MNWTLEVVIVPVMDVNRAKDFYHRQLGFGLDFDHAGGNMRVVQLTPLGSGCSIQIGQGITKMPPGTLKGLQLVVRDLKTAHAELLGRDVAVSEIQVFGQSGLRPYQDEDDLNNIGFFFFDDPDGNSWAVQQISNRQ